MSYFVIKRVTCAECSGRRWIQPAIWQDFWERERAQPQDGLSGREWWQSQGYDEPPPEERPCQECEGSGVFEHEVSLADALQDLGLMEKPATAGE